MPLRSPSKPHVWTATYSCEYIDNIDNTSKSFVPHHLPFLCNSTCNFVPIYILIHLPSKLFIYLLFAPIYAFFVNLSFTTSSIPPSLQPPFFQLQPLSHHSCTVNHCSFHSLPHFRLHPILFNTPNLSFCILMFPQFLNDNFHCPIHHPRTSTPSSERTDLWIFTVTFRPLILVPPLFLHLPETLEPRYLNSSPASSYSYTSPPLRASISFSDTPPLSFQALPLFLPPPPTPNDIKP